jgi:hypothetical protein
MTPSPSGEVVAWKYRDQVIPLRGAVSGEPPWPTNDIWYLTEGGYIHSGYVQPVEDSLQPVFPNVEPPGFWGEVCVPWAEAHANVGDARVLRKLYYGTIYRVVKAARDDAGRYWYQLQEGFTASRPSVFVPARTIRLIPRSALNPLSPGRTDKAIRISLGEQSLTCLEGDTAVYTTLIGAGHAATPTPRGEFRVLYKRHTRRMANYNIADSYDLPGVPFPVYITWNGVAIHGTYWHNDYGRVHSHGCVNVSPEASRWIFRWVDPVAPYDAYTTQSEPLETGTPVTVTW